MILPDVNVLLYAFRRDAERHDDYRSWLDKLVNGEAAYGISPQVLASVIRIGTHRRIYVHPSTTPEAVAFCDAILQPDHCTRRPAGRPPLGYLHEPMSEVACDGELGAGCVAGRVGYRIGVRVGHYRPRLRPFSRPPLAGAVLNPGAEVDSIDAWEVALFLPFGRTKDRQTPASAGTKRRAEIVGF